MLKKLILVGALSSIAMTAVAAPVQSVQRQTCHSTIIVDGKWADYRITFNARNEYGQIVQSLGTYKGRRGIVHAYYPCQDQQIVIEATPEYKGQLSSDESFVSQDTYNMNNNISAGFPGNFQPDTTKTVK